MSRRAACLLPAVVALALAGPAWAHAILVRSDPAAGATVPPGTLSFHLHFNSRIDRARSRLTLTAPDGAHSVLPIGQADPPDTLTTAAPVVPGAWSLRWQVLATDGHVTRGDLRFTVAP